MNKDYFTLAMLIQIVGQASEEALPAVLYFSIIKGQNLGVRVDLDANNSHMYVNLVGTKPKAFKMYFEDVYLKYLAVVINL